MKRVLKTYQLELEVCGPVYVGSGMEIQKKEYLFLNEKPNPPAMLGRME